MRISDWSSDVCSSDLFSHQCIDARTQRRRHLRDDQVLVGRQAETARIQFGNRAQPAQVRRTGLVGNTPGAETQRQMTLAVITIDPTETIAAVLDRYWPNRPQLKADTPSNGSEACKERV